MNAFITEWNMTAGNFTLPLRSGYTYNMVVDWGDGSPTSQVSAYNAPEATHEYLTAGTYQISITGTCEAWYINNNASIKTLITKVIQWGDVGFTILNNSFFGCSELIELPSGPITGASAVTNCGSMHYLCSKLPSIPDGYFDLMPNVTSFIQAFHTCTGLLSIPQYLFRLQTNCTAFSKVFMYVHKAALNKYIFYAEGEESTRFLNKSLNVGQAFYRTVWSGSVAGEAPELWNCNYGTGTPSFLGCYQGNGNNINSISNYCSIPNSWGSITTGVCAKIDSIGSSWYSVTQEKISVTSSVALAETDTLICYISTVLAGLVSPENEVPLAKINDNLYEALATVLGDATIYYVHISYTDGVNPETLDFNSIHYQVHLDTTIINIALPENRIIITDHKWNHGLLYHNGFIYGSARNQFETGGGYSGSSIFKLKADDYTIVTQKYIYHDDFNPNIDTVVANLDQIVYCKGFLWCQGWNYNSKYIIRINPDDLSYIVFNSYMAVDGFELSQYLVGGYGQPIGTDGTDLFITNNSHVFKVDTDQLLYTAANYGYNGSSPVTLTQNIILGKCEIIQYHPNAHDSYFNTVYSHSIIVDSGYVYIGATTGGGDNNGYDAALDLYEYHLQKIDKTNMQLVGDVVIPKATDDIAVNDNYIFLAPEYQDKIGSNNLWGADWGLFAINKSTLELKYLKALYKDFNTDSVLDRQCYGVFYYDNHVAVQLVDSKKTVIISLDEIESWNETFPIGGATKAIYQFQIDGVNLTAPPNEMVIDDSDFVHICTWETNTKVLKFPRESIIEISGIKWNNTTIIKWNNVGVKNIR